MEIKKIGVVGCGLMGGGITEVCARSGYDVVTLDIKQEFLDKGIGGIRTSLERGVKKGPVDRARRRTPLQRASRAHSTWKTSTTVT